MPASAELDREMMGRCLQLAQRARGKTAPNPLVGCVIVQGETVVGEGFHPGPGQPHAEIFALTAAGEQARGATLYVNLEPCCHYGRTPPCTEAILAAGLARVVVGLVDPDPRVSGGGHAQLQAAGLAVTVGVEEAACRPLNEAFIHRSRYQRPFGLLKYAMTLDGKIAASTGHSAWITSEKARQRVYEQRAAADAVIIGGNTVRRDNPRLTTHGLSDRNPLRVVMSRKLDLPVTANLWHTEAVSTLVFTEMGANLPLQRLLMQRGVEVVELPALEPAAVMANLYDRGFMQVMWECGGLLAARAIADGAVQKVMAFIAPKIIGGLGAPTPVGDLGLKSMTEALRLEGATCQVIAPDFLIEGYLPVHA